MNNTVLLEKLASIQPYYAEIGIRVVDRLQRDMETTLSVSLSDREAAVVAISVLQTAILGLVMSLDD